MNEESIDPFRKLSIDIEKVLLALFEESLEGILVVDQHMQIVMANKRAVEIFEHPRDKMLGMQISQLLPQALRQLHQKHTAKYVNAPKALQKHGRDSLSAITASGEEKHLGISLNPITIASGNYTIAHMVDQSEKTEINQSLTENQNLLKALIDNAVDGIITINRQGIIETMNPAAARLFGYKKEEVIGKNIHVLMPEPFHSEHDDYLDNYHKTGIAKIIGIGREVIGKKKDGTIFPFYLSVSKIDLIDGHRYAGIVHDLTEQKAAEASLKQYSEELEQRVDARTSALAQAIKGLEKEVQERKLTEEALQISQEETQKALKKERELNELKSRFVSMASHEFRTPLATILSSLNLIEKYQDPQYEDRKQKHMGRIKSNVKNLTDILNDFLSISKLEEGKISVEQVEFDIKSLAEELTEDFKLQVKEGQQINYAHEGAESRVLLDPKLIQNVLINLLSNAIKYSPVGGHIDFSTSLTPKELLISIRDQGIGIPEEEIHHLFERFFRAKNANNIQGTGLGLSIVKRHVELMQGEIEVESALNQGTKVMLRFPLH